MLLRHRKQARAPSHGEMVKQEDGKWKRGRCCDSREDGGNSDNLFGSIWTSVEGTIDKRCEE